MIPWACSPSSPIGSSLSLYSGYCLPYSLPYRPLPSTLLCDSCSACLLPTVHPGNTPYTLGTTSFTPPFGERSKISNSLRISDLAWLHQLYIVIVANAYAWL